MSGRVTSLNKKRLMSVFAALVMVCFASPLAALQNSQACAVNASRPQHIQKVLLVVAMDKEAAPIIEALHLTKATDSFSGLPMQSYVGKFANLDILLMLNGKDPMYHVQNVGTQAATLTTWLGIEQFHPDLVISIGTAGGVAENGAKAGDVYMSKKIYFYDRRIWGPGYVDYGLGGYSSACFDRITRQLNIKTGIICSGDSFDTNQTDKQVILKNGCDAVEMEAAGVAWVSMLMKTPMIAIKAITDTDQSKNSAQQYEKNFKAMRNKLVETLKQFLSNVSLTAAL